MSSDKIMDKLNEGMKYLDEVKQVSELNYDEMMNDFYKYRTAERVFEVISQVIIDVCTQVVASVGTETPETYASCFDILGRKNIIDKDLTQKLADLARMRNLVGNRYGTKNYNILLKALKQLVHNYTNYRNQIMSWYKSLS